MGPKQAAQLLSPVKSGLHVKEALQLLQIDHTLVDVVVVDEFDREPIGRPWLTLAIDVATRMVPGFHLTLEAPSANLGCPGFEHGGVAEEQVPGRSAH